MTHRSDREPIVSDGPYAIDDLATITSRLRGLETDTEESPESVELTCHDCGKTWTYTGSDEHAAYPNCEGEVPVEGIGP